MEVPCKLDPESNDEIDDKEDIEELDETSVVEESVSETPSSAERVSKPVVLESPKSAVAVSPVPVVLLEVLFSVLLRLDSLVFPEPESVGMETDGIAGDDISGIDTEGMLVCANNVLPPMLAKISSEMQSRKLRIILQVRKTLINHFQSGSEL